MVFSSYINKSLIDSLKSMEITGYVSKGSRTEDLLTGIRKLIASENYLCPEVEQEQFIKDDKVDIRTYLDKTEKGLTVKVFRRIQIG